MVTDRVLELKVQMDTVLRRPGRFLEEPDGDDAAIVAQAVQAFLDAGPEILDDATPYLWAYYRSTFEDFPVEDREAWGIPTLSDGADIWEQVDLQATADWGIGGKEELMPDPSYLSFEGEVSWEPEHGLQLVLAEGIRVCKVGPYDGHMTNAHAYGDLSKLGIIYSG